MVDSLVRFFFLSRHSKFIQMSNLIRDLTKFGHTKLKTKIKARVT